VSHRVVFLGSKSLGLNVLRALTSAAPEVVTAAITVDDSGDARSRLPEIARLCRDTDVPLHCARSREQAEQQILDQAPHLCVVACWYWLISPPLLAAVPRGFVGIHNSLLPKYRGGSPLVWALINGDREVGASVFSFRDGVDDGPIWLQVRIPVSANEYVDSVLARLESATLEAFAAALPAILAGTSTLREQDHAAATYCAQRRPADGEIDWTSPASSVFDFVRAQSPPYPGAFTTIDGRHATVLRASVFPFPMDGTPGQVARVDHTRVLVVCGSRSALELEQIDLGDGPVAARDVLRSVHPRVSARRASAALLQP
jgi:methionyl-tRNA formyltransferase